MAAESFLGEWEHPTCDNRKGYLALPAIKWLSPCVRVVREGADA